MERALYIEPIQFQRRLSSVRAPCCRLLGAVAACLIGIEERGIWTQS
jgi:hypothetical protein